MRRITRNERIRDIKPERERGPMVFKLPPRGDADHDPMFPRPTGVGVARGSAASTRCRRRRHRQRPSRCKSCSNITSSCRQPPPEAAQ